MQTFGKVRYELAKEGGLSSGKMGAVSLAMQTQETLHEVSTSPAAPGCRGTADSTAVHYLWPRPGPWPGAPHQPGKHVDILLEKFVHDELWRGTAEDALIKAAVKSRSTGSVVAKKDTASRMTSPSCLVVSILMEPPFSPTSM